MKTLKKNKQNKTRTKTSKKNEGKKTIKHLTKKKLRYKMVCIKKTNKKHFVN